MWTFPDSKYMFSKARLTHTSRKIKIDETQRKIKETHHSH